MLKDLRLAEGDSVFQSSVTGRLPANVHGTQVHTACDSSPAVAGIIEDRISQILATLVDQGVLLQHTVRTATEQVPRTRSRPKDTIQKLALETILYGPWSLSEAVGDFLMRCDMYLHDPVDCISNVRYRNPQSLWAQDEDDIRMTYDLKSTPEQYVETYHNPADLLQELEYEDQLPEAAQPTAIRTTLHPYVFSLRS